jgi:aryl-alcohol dehydrogenase-like predicted oxidoreductase
MADDGLTMINSASDAAFEGPHVNVAVQRPVPEGDRACRTSSALGLGTVKFGRNINVRYPGGEGFALPSDREIETLLDVAAECGIRTLDTAPAYGTAEERLGKLLRTRRREFFLITKTGEEFADGKSRHDFTAAHTRMSVERSLRRLNTDFLDCVLCHSGHDDIEVITSTAVLETLARLKDEGKIGAFGVSTYTVEGGRLALERCDAVMVAYNRAYTAQRPVIDAARASRKLVFVKKGLASGHVGDVGNVADNIRFILGTPGVTTLLFGSIDPANIRANAAALTPDRAVGQKP